MNTTLTCPACGSSRLRPETRAPNPTGRPRDHQQRIDATCLECGVTSDVSAAVVAAEARGDGVVIGGHALRHRGRL